MRNRSALAAPSGRPRTVRSLAAAMLVVCAAATLYAQPVTVTTSTALTPADTTFPGTSVPTATAQVTVQNATLTVSGEVAIASLTVASGGVVTHPAGYTYTSGAQTIGGFHLHTTGDVVVMANGAIDVSAKGYDGGQGPGAGTPAPTNGQCAGGGGYGGSGASGTSVAGGALYGSFAQPIDLGSGGGAANSNPGKRGGGSVRLSVGGAMTLDGVVNADGATATGNYSGAGSGGSIWIAATTLSGAGTIHATGGTANFCGTTVATGAGGRVAVYANLASFNSSASAISAAGAPGAGPGTVYKAQTGQSAQLILDNAGNAGRSVYAAPLVVPSGVNVFIRNGATLSHVPGAASGLSVQVADNLTVESGGSIDVSGRGYDGGQGPGVGFDASTSGQCAGGGGYGGSGGAGTSVIGGGTYGSYAQPIDLGSGGGAANNNSGHRGGGAARVTVGGTLTLDGSIAADGDTANGNYSGAGAGGSIWVSAATLTGAGTIHANGGTANFCGTSLATGGGGRVAVYGDFSTFGATAIQAHGGPGAGAGTFYKAQTSQRPQLIFDNAGQAGVTALSAPLVVPAGVDVFVRNGASFSHAPGNTAGLTAQIADNLTIESTGSIDVSGKGYVGGQGPGAGAAATTNGQCAGGGGYGGSGAFGTTVAGGTTYGSFAQPTDLGSGGGAANSASGKPGGGAVRVIVGSTLTVNGVINADGSSAAGNYWGAGSGGSIWITAGTLTGAGTIHANGGTANFCGTSLATGGGGRVAVYGDFSTFGATSMQAYGAPGAGAGSVYKAQTGQASAQLVYDNNNQQGLTELDSPLIVPTGVNVLVRNGAGFTHAAGNTSGLSISVADNLSIGSGSSIDVNGKGYPGGQGPGAGQSEPGSGRCAGGGGYGGLGGPGTSVAGGTTYGSPAQPTDLGSGGGGANSNSGKPGGGAIKLIVGGTLTVDGTIGADGASAAGNYFGAGSGGSVWITTTTLAGAGMIHASGGAANFCGTSIATGGGGRIAVYGCTSTLPMANIAAHGAPGAHDGTVYFDPTAVAVVLRQITAGSACPGSTIQLTAQTVNGTSFQWRRNGQPIVDGPGVGNTTFSGSTTSVLTVTNVSPLDGRAEITVAVGNSCGNVISSPPLHLICSADFNCSGTVTVQDIFDFLAAWFQADARADFNGAGGLGVQDIFDFLAAWFGGC